MGLTLREGRKIARTAATIDRVYSGGRQGSGGVKGSGLFLFRQMAVHGYMPIIPGTYLYLRDLLIGARYMAA
jgi:hypothetical protein